MFQFKQVHMESIRVEQFYRMDDVPISLRPAFDSPFPSDLEVLTKLRKKVNELSKKANRPYSTKKYM